MSKAEQFVKDCTNHCSNLLVFTEGDKEYDYAPWLTPDQALRAVEIAREEMIDFLEVKEVDLEDDVDKILEANDWNFDKIDFYQFAKYFFELGLKTQKGG